MNKNLLRSYMARCGDTQETLAEAMGISRSRLNAKLNETTGAEFKQREIEFMAVRYQMTPEELASVFFPRMAQ